MGRSTWALIKVLWKRSHACKMHFTHNKESYFYLILHETGSCFWYKKIIIKRAKYCFWSKSYYLIVSFYVFFHLFSHSESHFFFFLSILSFIYNIFNKKLDKLFPNKKCYTYSSSGQKEKFKKNLPALFHISTQCLFCCWYLHFQLISQVFENHVAEL